MSERVNLWCETCRDTHGPSGPHIGEIVSPDKAEILREIDRQHAAEPEPEAIRALIEKWRESADWEHAHMGNTQYAAALDQCANDLEALVGTPESAAD